MSIGSCRGTSGNGTSGLDSCFMDLRLRGVSSRKWHCIWLFLWPDVRNFLSQWLHSKGREPEIKTEVIDFILMLCARLWCQHWRYHCVALNHGSNFISLYHSMTFMKFYHCLWTCSRTYIKQTTASYLFKIMLQMEIHFTCVQSRVDFQTALGGKQL